jgi:hypothetical protein
MVACQAETHRPNWAVRLSSDPVWPCRDECAHLALSGLDVTRRPIVWRADGWLRGGRAPRVTVDSHLPLVLTYGK